MNAESKIKIAFGQVLAGLRKRRGYTQEALANESGLDRTYISLLERGLRQPTLETVFALAAPLGLRPSRIVRLVEGRLPGVPAP